MKRALLAIIAMIILLGAMDAKHKVVNMGVQIDALGLDASRAFELELSPDSSWGVMVLYIQLLDANNSTTALNMSCTGSLDNNTTDYTLHSCDTVLGTATCYNLTWTTDPSGVTSPKKHIWRVDIEGLQDIECTFTDTGGVAADKLTVTASLAIKG